MSKHAVDRPRIIPPHVAALGSRIYVRDQGIVTWTDRALAVMDDAFCAVMRKAHPDRELVEYR